MEIPKISGVPLVLDLDGTVVRSNLLVETALVFLKKTPLKVFMLLIWLLRGRAVLKQKLAAAALLEVDTLPLNRQLLKHAESEAALGREIFIATAADLVVAKKVAARIPFITDVIASDGRVNLKGVVKAQVLSSRFPDGFEYAGDAKADLAVWRIATSAIVVEASPSLVNAAAAVTSVTRVFSRPSRLIPLIKSMRPHQWAKNILVFVPLILSARLTQFEPFISTFIAFIAMNLIASATYIINDLFDLADDRRHWSKSCRPLASGDLPLLMGASIAFIGLLFGLGLALMAGPAVTAGILSYAIITLSYSFSLKSKPIIDAFTLASLFTLRLGIGILASGSPPSPWLLVFSTFLFASLSFAKRYTEVAGVIKRGGTDVRGRGYQIVDLPLILALGVSSGICAVFIMVLYIIEDAFRQSFYGNPLWLWGFPIILFLFISRVWLMCQREQMHDDPVAFAVRDRPSLILGFVLMICFLAAWIGEFS